MQKSFWWWRCTAENSTCNLQLSSPSCSTTVVYVQKKLISWGQILTAQSPGPSGTGTTSLHPPTRTHLTPWQPNTLPRKSGSCKAQGSAPRQTDLELFAFSLVPTKWHNGQYSDSGHSKEEEEENTSDDHDRRGKKQIGWDGERRRRRKKRWNRLQEFCTRLKKKEWRETITNWKYYLNLHMPPTSCYLLACCYELEWWSPVLPIKETETRDTDGQTETQTHKERVEKQTKKSQKNSLSLFLSLSQSLPSN